MMAASRRRTVLPLVVAGVAAWLSWGVVSPADAAAAARVAWLPGGGLPIATALAVVVVAALARVPAGVLWLTAFLWLPWVPVRGVPALAMWHGPIAWTVWAAVAFLGAWPWLARAGARVAARPPRDQAILAMVVAALAYLGAGWRMQPQVPGGDEPHYLVITQSLLADRDLRIENNHRRRDYLAYTTQELKPDYLRRGIDREIYSIHAPGTSALVLPAFAIAGYPGVVVFLALLAAMGTGLVWLAAWHVSGDARAAWVGWAGVALSAPFLFQSFTVYPDGPGAVFVMAAVFALVVPGRLRRPGACALHGAAAAVLPWLHTRYALLAGVLGVALVLRIAGGEMRERRPARVAALLAVPVVSALAWFWFFHAIYGTFNPAAPYGGYTQSQLSNAARGLTGLLVDQQFGVLPNAPIYAAAFVGWWTLARSRRCLAWELAALVVPYAVAVASYQMWWGGRSAPARFLVPVLLPLGIAIAVVWQSAGRVGRAVIGVALATSAGLALALAWADRGAFVYNFRDGFALWLDAAAPLVRLPLALPSVFRGSLADAWLVAAIWMAVGALSVVVAARISRRGGAAAPAGALLLGAICAVSLSWLATGARALDPGTGLLGVLSAASERPGWGWRSERPFALATSADLSRTLAIPSADRRLTTPTDPLWEGTDVPPGEYRLRASSGLRVHGHLSVMIGRGPAPIVEADLQDAVPDALPVALMLPAGAGHLAVTGDADVRRTGGSLSLVPVRLDGPAGVAAGGARARGVARYAALTWFLDSNAFVEPGGFWVRGGSETACVVDGGGRRLRLAVTAGPVATSVTVRIGTAGSPAFARTLSPGEQVIVPVSSEGPVLVRLESAQGFRPADMDPQSGDTRWLGVWVELREP